MGGTSIDRTWLQARIDATKASILAVEAAMDALLVGGAQSYTLDTGQTRQTVTKADISGMRLMLGNLENRLATLDARLNGCSTRIIPGW